MENLPNPAPKAETNAKNDAVKKITQVEKKKDAETAKATAPTQYEI